MLTKNISRVCTFDPDGYEKLELMTYEIRKRGCNAASSSIVLMTILEQTSSIIDEKFMKILKHKLKERTVRNAHRS